MERDTMRYWLGQAARAAREASGRKTVHVGASANKDQSTIWRFEQGEGWPQDPDLIVAAYADDLDIDPIDLWEQALKMWRESGERASVTELLDRERQRKQNPAAAVERTAKAAAAAIRPKPVPRRRAPRAG